MKNRKRAYDRPNIGFHLSGSPVIKPKMAQDLHFAETKTAKYQNYVGNRQLTKFQKRRITKELKSKLRPIQQIQVLVKVTADKETYKKQDWLLQAQSLVFNTNCSIEQAVKTVTEKAKQADLSNFAHLYGYYLNYACMGFWEDDNTQFISPVTYQPLFHLEHIRYLCAVMIRYVFSDENQPVSRTMKKQLQLNCNAGESTAAAKELLVEMFSDGKEYRNIQDFISVSKSIEWNSSINLAMYAYFNKGLDSNKAGIDDTKMVIGAMTYFSSFMDGELEMEYSPTTMPNICKEEFAKYLKLNGIIFTS